VRVSTPSVYQAGSFMAGNTTTVDNATVGDAEPNALVAFRSVGRTSSIVEVPPPERWLEGLRRSSVDESGKLGRAANNFSQQL
jgi:hypothetical protein